jgi:hypothetical protein
MTSFVFSQPTLFSNLDIKLEKMKNRCSCKQQKEVFVFSTSLFAGIEKKTFAKKGQI